MGGVRLRRHRGYLLAQDVELVLALQHVRHDAVDVGGHLLVVRDGVGLLRHVHPDRDLVGELAADLLVPDVDSRDAGCAEELSFGLLFDGDEFVYRWHCLPLADLGSPLRQAQ